MKQWWFSHTEQERLAIIIAAAVVTLLCAYLFLWIPFNKQIEAKKHLVESQIASLNWIKEKALEVKALRGRLSTVNSGVANEALLTLVDRTAKQNQLREFIQRLKPQENDAVQLWLEEVPFDRLIQWLGLLVNQYDISLDSISIERKDKPGTVDARITLQRESS